MATQIPTIDSQLHASERNRPERPWSGVLQGPDEVTGDDMVAAMDAGGVDGALLVSPCRICIDWTRAVGLLTYEQGVEAFRVTDQLAAAERAALMGGSLAQIYNWSPDMGD